MIFYDPCLISAPIDVVKLITNDTRAATNDTKVTYGFEALTPTRVVCRSEGGNPKPQLRVLRSEFDVTNEFNETVKEIVTGEKGLEQTKYEIELATVEFRADMKDQGEMLKCIVRIHKMHEFKKTQGGVMEVTCEYIYRVVEQCRSFRMNDNHSFGIFDIA